MKTWKLRPSGKVGACFHLETFWSQCLVGLLGQWQWWCSQVPVTLWNTPHSTQPTHTWPLTPGERFEASISSLSRNCPRRSLNSHSSVACKDYDLMTPTSARPWEKSYLSGGFPKQWLWLLVTPDHDSPYWEQQYGQGNRCLGIKLELPIPSPAPASELPLISRQNT